MYSLKSQCKLGTNFNSSISTSLIYINNATILGYFIYYSLWYTQVMHYDKFLGSLRLENLCLIHKFDDTKMTGMSS